jgi:ATP-dependent DNA ligase
MAARNQARRLSHGPRIESGRVQLLTRTGLDWTGKYPGAIAALANLNVKTAYIDGELCGDPAFDLLHLGGWDISSLPLIRRRNCSSRWSQTSQAFNTTARQVFSSEKDRRLQSERERGLSSAPFAGSR